MDLLRHTHLLYQLWPRSWALLSTPGKTGADIFTSPGLGRALDKNGSFAFPGCSSGDKKKISSLAGEAGIMTKEYMRLHENFPVGTLTAKPNQRPGLWGFSSQNRAMLWAWLQNEIIALKSSATKRQQFSQNKLNDHIFLKCQSQV